MIKNILVTGGAGFIGSNLVNKISNNEDFAITVVDDLSTGKVSNIENLNRVTLVNDFSMLSKNNYDVIFHFAADADMRNDSINAYRKNIEATQNALSCLKPDGHFYFSSSCSIYGYNENNKETDLIAPSTLYAISKVVSEKMIIEKTSKYFIFRYANVFGKNQDGARESGIIAIIKSAYEERKPIKLFNQGTSSRDFINVESIVHYMLNITECGIYNLGSGQSIAIIDIVNSLNLQHIDSGFKQEVIHSKLNIDKIRQLDIVLPPVQNVIEYIIQGK